MENKILEPGKIKAAFRKNQQFRNFAWCGQRLKSRHQSNYAIPQLAISHLSNSAVLQFRNKHSAGRD